MIAMVGNPFSPAYARARAAGRSSPFAHAALNVAVYGRGAAAWSLTERVIAPDDRSADGAAFGRSTIRWDRDALVVDIDERTTPFGRPVRGRVTLEPEVVTSLAVPLDRASSHRWWPVAPLARVEVDLREPRVRFRGHGYHDANAGGEPLEAAFTSWSWSRARGRGEALLTYDVRDVDGHDGGVAFGITSRGDVSVIEAPGRTSLPRTLWGIDRTVRGDARLIRSLEDGPFYARALVEQSIAGQRVVAMHEALSAARLRRRWVRFLTGFRMGRAA